MAAFWAWVNNVLELRVDAFKLTRTQRRPAVHRVGHIGAWQVIRPLPPPRASLVIIRLYPRYCVWAFLLLLFL